MNLSASSKTVSESIAIKTVYAKIAMVSKIRNCFYWLKCRIVRKFYGQRLVAMRPLRTFGTEYFLLNEDKIVEIIVYFYSKAGNGA